MAPVATAHPEAPLAGRAPSAADPPSDAPRPRLFEPGGTTLEDSIVGVWADLLAERRAECPVCGGAMTLLSGCSSCGSELS